MKPPDLDVARQWFGRAADAGHTGAMTALGDLYSQSMQPPDLASARHWYERARAAGDRGAMHNLEVLFGEPDQTPTGWGVQPPTDEEMDAMVDWMHGPGAILSETFEPAFDEIIELGTSSERPDEATTRATFRNVCGRFIDELPAALPSPDPELNRALQGLIDDANEWTWTDRELSDLLTPQQRETLQSRGGELMSRIQVLLSVLERDIGILEATGRG
jgi:TPR repeat protein